MAFVCQSWLSCDNLIVAFDRVPIVAFVCQLQSWVGFRVSIVAFVCQSWLSVSIVAFVCQSWIRVSIVAFVCQSWLSCVNRGFRVSIVARLSCVNRGFRVTIVAFDPLSIVASACHSRLGFCVSIVAFV